MGRKKKDTRYFTEETEKAVRDYIKSTDDRERNKIFNTYLYKPLRKISEIYVNSISMDYVADEKEDLINDCLTHLITNCFSKFDVNTQSKAYSYFSVAAKYWCMQLNMRAYNRSKKGVYSLDILRDSPDESYDRIEYNTQFTKRYYSFIEWMRFHLPALNYGVKIKKSMLATLEFLEEFDEVDDFLKIRINEKFRNRFPEFTDALSRFGRVCLYEQYLHYCKSYDEGEFNPIPRNPNKKTGTYYYRFSTFKDGKLTRIV